MTKTVTYQGCIVRPEHLETMQVAAKNTSGWGRLNLSQGGYSHYSKSGGTHAKLDVADIKVGNATVSEILEFCENLFECGNLPFPRGIDPHEPGNFVRHIHNIWWPGTYGTKALQNQYYEFLNGGDGLVGSGRYYGPRHHKLNLWADSMFNPANRTMYDQPKPVVVTADNLLGLSRYRERKVTRPKGYELTVIGEIKRWDRINYVTAQETFYAAQYCTPKESK